MGRPVTRLVAGAFVGIGLAAGALAVWAWTSRGEPLPDPPVRLVVALPGDLRVIDVAVAPGGDRIAYVAQGEGVREIYLRSLDRFEAVSVPGTDGATDLFFSPDGLWLGFFADGRLRKVSTDGGTPVTICDVAGEGAGASWGDDGLIVFAAGPASGLARVPADGGPVAELTTPDRDGGEMAHGWPEVLPGNEAVVFTTSNEDRGGRLAVLSLTTGTWRPLLPGAGQARYAPSGHLVYANSGELLAAPFDIARLALTGPPVSAGARVADAPMALGGLGRTPMAISRSGTLVYVPAPATVENVLVWVDRAGRATPAADVRTRHHTPRLSPDGRRVAVVVRSGMMGRDIWIHDLDQGSRTRLTTEGSDNRSPVWRPDGQRLTFASNRSGAQSIYTQPLAPGGQAEPVSSTGDAQNPTSWSADGRVLTFYVVTPEADRNVWTLHVGEAPSPFKVTPLNERAPMLSPDGGWLAYVTGEAGRDTVYVSRYPDGEPTVPIGEGREPTWGPNGQELFFRHGSRMMAASVTLDDQLSVGAVRPLFDGQYEPDPGGHTANYDVSPDGERFLMVQPADPPDHLRVVLHWAPATP